MKENYTNIDWLRGTGCVPKWFGLGFIQLKLDAKRRMHFWHPDLLPDDPSFDKEWHDHRYDFTSNVLRGTIVNETASIYPKTHPHNSQAIEQHALYEVCCSGGGSEFKSWVNHIEPRATFETSAGCSYFLNRDTFHRVSMAGDGRVATLQTRDTDLKSKARLVRVHGTEIVNPFDSSYDAEHLWDYIADVLGRPGYHIREIEKGELGEASKIREEVDELLDAVAQDARVMQLVELSDTLGAIEAFMAKYHPGYSLDDLLKMKDITSRAFRNGRRS